MAESPIEKLKRLAREKKEQAVKMEVAKTQPVIEEEVKDESASTTLETIQVKDGEIGTGVVVQEGSSGELSTSANIDEKETIQLEDASLNITTGELTPTPSNHPLAMEFAELESMLLSADPQFRFQLRNVHRHLGKEPELVTMMTEEEIQRVVRGLKELANSEIVEPAKTKAVKKATNEMKKKVISADDL